MKIPGQECYRIYLGLKTHFRSDSYNYLFYNKTVSHKIINGYDSRPERFHYQRLAGKFTSLEDLELHILANLIEHPKMYITELLTEEAFKRGRDMKGRHGALTYIYQKDIQHIFDRWEGSAKELFRFNSDTPPIVKFYLWKEITLESLVILDGLLRLNEKWDMIDPNHFVLQDVKFKIFKYRDFVNYNRKECAEFLKKNISEHAKAV